jgi:hypothetical protein
MSSQGRGELRRNGVLSWLRSRVLLGLIVSPLLLGGCSVPKLSSPFGAGSEDSSSASLANDGRLPEMGSAEANNSAALNCPQVVAWPNERLRTVYQSGHDGDQDFAINRGEITKLSRECRFYAGGVVVKYAFAGRVLLGPKGKPGTVTVPVSIRAAGANRQTLATDKMSVRATIPQGKTAGYFSMVREISFPVQVGTRPEDYKIFMSLKK